MTVDLERTGVADRIRKARLRRGWNIGELARRAES